MSDTNTPYPSFDQCDWVFSLCPAPPDWRIDWGQIEACCSWLEPLRGCRQDPCWHREGDVLTHTEAACNELAAMCAWRNLCPTGRSITFLAVLMHDIAKPRTSVEQEGRIRSPRHAPKGAQMARTILWEKLLPATSVEQMQIREQIVALIAHHSMPPLFFSREDWERHLFGVSLSVRCDLLSLVSEADVRGRICDNSEERLEKIELFREFTRENDCFNRPRYFASNHTRVLYFRGGDLSPDVEIYDDCRCEVTLMSGLPGSGKDTWIRENVDGTPIISLDAIRNELGVLPTDVQSPVVMRAKDLAREFLRRGEPFVWNATNTTRQMRSSLLQLFYNYKARVRTVYLETEWSDLLRRNRSRKAKLPEVVLYKLAEKLDVPRAWECHQTDLMVTYEGN